MKVLRAAWALLLLKLRFRKEKETNGVYGSFRRSSLSAGVHLFRWIIHDFVAHTNEGPASPIRSRRLGLKNGLGRIPITNFGEIVNVLRIIPGIESLRKGLNWLGEKVLEKQVLLKWAVVHIVLGLRGKSVKLDFLLPICVGCVMNTLEREDFAWKLLPSMGP